uniref:D-cysteine desulfhydrase n=1 Tax=Kalanchoe fedtschenkoi TaxID=63787 RepID=A0A7N0UXW5_KALFE
MSSSSPPLMPCVSCFRRLSSSNPLACAVSRRHFRSSTPSLEPANDEFVERLLHRRWMLPSPDTKIHQVSFSANTKVQNNKGLFGEFRFMNNPNPLLGRDDAIKDRRASFYAVRDDLLHPLINGNKARKLDALLPLFEQHGVTDVVTCGGCQSAHTAAVGVTCAERGLNSHLLLRGEQPETLTGYNLMSSIYGNVSYVPRSLYANREEMLKKHAAVLAGQYGSLVFLNDLAEEYSGAELLQKPYLEPVKPLMSSGDMQKKVVIINEGAGDGVALLGVIRLVSYLSKTNLFGKKRAVKFVVDAGTGTTAVGLALGAVCLGLPWEITAIMLADSIDGYLKKEKELISDFKRQFGLHAFENVLNKIDGGVVHWVERRHPRKFGNVLEGEVEACQQIAQQTGISVDPVYTLAAWELAVHLSQNTKEGTAVVMLHTGGTLGMFGLAQRYKSYFQNLKAD